jgi:hypothetical protein
MSLFVHITYSVASIDVLDGVKPDFSILTYVVNCIDDAKINNKIINKG